jgi:hypothetical protein
MVPPRFVVRRLSVRTARFLRSMLATRCRRWRARRVCMAAAIFHVRSRATHPTGRVAGRSETERGHHLYPHTTVRVLAGRQGWSYNDGVGSQRRFLTDMRLLARVIRRWVPTNGL